MVLEIAFSDDVRQVRCPASLWWTGSALQWADPGWPTSPGFAFHHFPGELVGSGPWVLRPTDDSVIASITVRELVIGEQPATDEFLAWQAFRSSPAGLEYTDDAAFKAAAAFFQAA